MQHADGNPVGHKGQISTTSTCPQTLLSTCESPLRTGQVTESMAVRPIHCHAGQDLEKVQGNIINEYLGSSFGQLKAMGEHAYRPFMEDRLQWGTLSRLIAWQLLHSPGSIVQMTLFMKVPLLGGAKSVETIRQTSCRTISKHSVPGSIDELGATKIQKAS